MTKTYAFLDVIGTSSAFHEGEAAQQLTDFWTAAERWTNGPALDLGMRPLGQGGVIRQGGIYVVTFSDSALLHTVPEVELDDFYAAALGLKDAIERAHLSVYCIISRGAEVPSPQHPLTGGVTTVGGNLRPVYTNVAGSGAAWVDLHLADKAIRRRRAWHDTYSLYCVGEQSRDRQRPVAARQSFEGFDGTVLEVLALE